MVNGTSGCSDHTSAATNAYFPLSFIPLNATLSFTPHTQNEATFPYLFTEICKESPLPTLPHHLSHMHFLPTRVSSFAVPTRLLISHLISQEKSWMEKVQKKWNELRLWEQSSTSSGKAGWLGVCVRRSNSSNHPRTNRFPLSASQFNWKFQQSWTKTRCGRQSWRKCITQLYIAFRNGF